MVVVGLRCGRLLLCDHAASAISTVPRRSIGFLILAALVPMMVPVMFIHSDIPKLYTKARTRPFHITSEDSKKVTLLWWIEILTQKTRSKAVRESLRFCFFFGKGVMKQWLWSHSGTRKATFLKGPTQKRTFWQRSSHVFEGTNQGTKFWSLGSLKSLKSLIHLHLLK